MIAHRRRAPEVDAFASAFAGSAREGRLLFQRCRSCGRANPYTVTSLCHHCGSLDLAVLDAEGVGVVLSRTWVAKPADEGPQRFVMMVELAEGMRVLAVGAREDAPEIGDTVRFDHVKPSGGALVFRFVEAERRVSDPTSVA